MDKDEICLSHLFLWNIQCSQELTHTPHLQDETPSLIFFNKYHENILDCWDLYRDTWHGYLIFRSIKDKLNMWFFYTERIIWINNVLGEFHFLSMSDSFSDKHIYICTGVNQVAERINRSKCVLKSVFLIFRVENQPVTLIW